MIEPISRTVPVEIATVNEAKIYFKSEDSGGIEDSLIEDLIVSAREWIEKAMNRAVVESTVVIYAEDYKGFLPLNLVNEITTSGITYTGKTMPIIEVAEGKEITYTTKVIDQKIFKTATLELAKWWYERGEDTDIPEKILKIVRAYRLKP